MRNHKRGCLRYVLTTHCSGKLDVLFFIGYLLLLKIITSAIIKAMAMIVINIKEYNNMYIMLTNTDSIISLTSFNWRQPHLCLISFSMLFSLYYFLYIV